MRKYQNLELLLKSHDGDVNKTVFADLLLDDLKQSCCSVFGETVDEQAILLAELTIQADSLHLNSGMFHHRIEFVVEGEIVNDQYPPLSYSVNGSSFRFYGRCSTIPQICGVDLYLDKSYTEKAGDYVKQKFTIPVYKIFKSLK
jgi:hypothetical protein